MTSLRAVAPGCLIWCVAVASVAAQTPVSIQEQSALDLALANPDFGWEEAQTEHFRLHYAAGALTPSGVQGVGERLEDSLTKNLARLQEQYEPAPIRTVLVSSRAQMAEVVGAPYGGLALPAQRSLVFVTTPDGRAATQHELMHLLAYELWGTPFEPRQWISEGLATYAPGRCAEYTIPALAALMADLGLLPTLDSLVNDFYGTSDLYTYLAGASFVHLIAETYGMGAVRAFWRDGLEAGTSSLGMTVAELQQAWMESISTATAAPPDALDRIPLIGCEGP